MFPAPLAGLAVAGSTLLLKNKLLPQTAKIQFQLKELLSVKKRYKIKSPFCVNPLQSLFKSLSTMPFSKLKRPVKTDYNSIIKKFLPQDAVISVPRFPLHSPKYQVVDIDNDSRNEIVVSYKHRNVLKTIVLKQQEDIWVKTAEIEHSAYSGLHFRGIESLSGDGKKILLVGLQEEKSSPRLFGYSLEDNNIHELFERNYHRIELIPKAKSRNSPNTKQLAIWQKDGEHTYNIDVLHMGNGSLESINDMDSYYLNSVIPYYSRLIKRSPYDVVNWHNLADALIRIKSYNDAKTVIDIGSRIDADGLFSERFGHLKSKIK